MPVKGNIYTIRDILDVSYYGPCCRLQEIVNQPRQYNEGFHEAGYGVYGFRPVVERKTDISVFQSLLTPQKHRTTA